MLIRGLDYDMENKFINKDFFFQISFYLYNGISSENIYVILASMGWIFLENISLRICPMQVKRSFLSFLYIVEYIKTFQFSFLTFF